MPASDKSRKRSVSQIPQEMEPEQPAIPDELSKELEQHKGRWVAVDNKRLIAVGDSVAEVTEKALKKHVTDPLVFRVPLHPERINYL